MPEYHDDTDRCTRVIVYAATDGSGRTRTYPLADDLTAPREIDVEGTTFLLVADTRVLEALDATAARKRAWGAAHFGGLAA